MRDLRKQALESHKTVSRKQQAKMDSKGGSPTSTPQNGSRQGSRLATPAMSRMHSRIGSPDRSDAEDGSSSDDTMFSGSDLQYSDMEASGELSSLDGVAGWEAKLRDRIEELVDWKRSSREGRELCLRTYCRILQGTFAEDVIRGREQDLVISFLRSIKNEESDVEVERALKALEMTMITSGLDSIYEDSAPRIKRTIQDHESNRIKALAIHTLAFLAFCCGPADEGLIEDMDFFLEVIETDGESIDASDAPDPVIAAIEAYSFLATLVEDLSDFSADHVDILVEQLESSVPEVQVAAGEAIALLFEKSYTVPEADDDLKEMPADVVRDGFGTALLVHRYPAAHNEHAVREKLSSIVDQSGKSARRKDVRAARVSLKDILNSVEHPEYGPKYSDALTPDETSVYGSRLKVKVGRDNVMTIDKWWKLFRTTNLKRALQGGFLVHYEQNPLIFEALPIMVEQEKTTKKQKARRGA